MSNLTFFERQKIEFYLRLKLGIRDIARRLKRDHSVISREVRRNAGEYLPYSAVTAQKTAERRTNNANKRKLEKNLDLKEYVVKQLKKGWSPQQIAGRVKKEIPLELRGKTISHESIYQYVYNGEGRFEYLYPLLRKKRFKRQRRFSRKRRNLPITERVSIHLRPSLINLKERYGDWESDTVEFQKGKQLLSVQYERKSMVVRIHRLRNKSAEETEGALIKSVESLPFDLSKSVTFDNGSEGANHTRVRELFGISTYFCDPYSAWQKGGVENVNGLIRQYLPKSTDLSMLSDEELKKVQETLNNRPRKSLNYLTPNEVINREYNLRSGALNS